MQPDHTISALCSDAYDSGVITRRWWERSGRDLVAKTAGVVALAAIATLCLIGLIVYHIIRLAIKHWPTACHWAFMAADAALAGAVTVYRWHRAWVTAAVRAVRRELPTVLWVVRNLAQGILPATDRACRFVLVLG